MATLMHKINIFKHFQYGNCGKKVCSHERFPNKMPKVDWQRNFPVFKNVKGNDATLHLVRFHMHVCILKINFPEDCMMNIFMATLECEARSWYESLSPTCIYYLKDFHTMFFEMYKESCPSLILVQNCCKHVDSFIENLERILWR